MKVWLAVFFLLLFISPAVQAESIRFWTALPEPDHAVMANLVDEYNEAHASDSVEYRNFSSRQELYQALQENDLPNLALIDCSWIPDLKAKLYPADDILMQVSDMVRTMAKADTFRPIWDSCVQDGKAYAIPFSAESAALVINPLYFKKIPKIGNFSQWQKAALSLRKVSTTVSPMALPTFWDAPEIGKLWTVFAAANSRSSFWQKFLRKK